jgi:hypothetical protein
MRNHFVAGRWVDFSSIEQRKALHLKTMRRNPPRIAAMCRIANQHEDATCRSNGFRCMLKHG